MPDVFKNPGVNQLCCFLKPKQVLFIPDRMGFPILFINNIPAMTRYKE